MIKMECDKRMYFRIDTNKPILIYGAASIGLIIYDICKELGIPVLGFWDKRGDEINEINGLKVWGINDREIDTIDKNIVVFVAVKNVFEHDSIVRTLIGKGFTNIIYRPYSVIKGGGNKSERLLNETYEKFINGVLVEEDIPKTFKAFQYEYKDYATIQKMECERIVYVPLECLFTDKEEIVSRWNWSDIPIMALVSHIGFFRWMDQQDGYLPDKYLDWCINSAKTTGKIKITNRWKENVIKNRADVYINMNEALERDFDFFIRNAPYAKWNDNGYFNLVSGKHRATFWLAKGRRYIPLKISERDYEKWINGFQMDAIVEKICDKGILEVNAPVEHPFFYNFLCKNRKFYYNLLCEFMFKISTEQYEQMGCIKFSTLSPILISLNDDGYFARTLQRYGFRVKVYNKSIVCTILDDLCLKSNENVESDGYQYAFIEYNYGDELNIDEIQYNKIINIVFLVETKDCTEFERVIHKNYLINKIKVSYKDDKNTNIYWLENCRAKGHFSTL